MHRIEWTQNGETYAVATDESGGDALALFVAVRANVAEEGGAQLTNETVDLLKNILQAVESLSGDGSGE